MPSTASTLLKVELQASGENNNTWGTKANASLSRLEEGVAATTAVVMAAGTNTLSDTAYSANEARSMILALSGTSATIVIPNRSKLYLVKNAGSGTALIWTGSGTSYSVLAGDTEWIYCNGSNAVYGAFALKASDEATAAQFRANTASKVLTTDKVWSAADYVSLTDAATVALDMSAFLNGTVTLAGNRALGNPTNTKNGQSGVIKIVQDGTGSRTLSYSSNWKFAGGIAPVLTTTAAAVDLLHYEVFSSTFIFGTLVKDVK